MSRAPSRPQIGADDTLLTPGQGSPMAASASVSEPTILQSPEAEPTLLHGPAGQAMGEPAPGAAPAALPAMSLENRLVAAALDMLLMLTPLASAAQVLNPLIVEALASHPAAQSARQQQAAARAGLAGARWQYWPTPSVTVENARVGAADSAYQGDSTVSVLRLQQPLWNGGRLAASGLPAWLWFGHGACPPVAAPIVRVEGGTGANAR